MLINEQRMLLICGTFYYGEWHLLEKKSQYKRAELKAVSAKSALVKGKKLTNW